MSLSNFLNNICYNEFCIQEEAITCEDLVFNCPHRAKGAKRLRQKGEGDGTVFPNWEDSF
jgi:hypothetical protein